MKERVLEPSFFEEATSEIARSLVGKKLIRAIGDEMMACRIVESEAYLPENDKACHAALRRTPKNEVMFGQPGLIYVYSIHAKHCVNFVTEREGRGCAVLIRAAKPLEGIESMKNRRSVESLKELMNGPGKLCQATGIDKNLNGKRLAESTGLWVVDDGVQLSDDEIKVTRRIGVTAAKTRLLRFVWKGSDYASGPKYLR